MYKLTKKDNWNASLYDEKHSFISQYGKDLIKLLAPVEGENILDVGCGTGDITKQLNDLGANIIGIDKSENMINQAQKKYPNIKFKVADVTELRYSNKFDAVISNATLHWVQSPKKALSCIYNSLKTEGRFVAELGGEGNVQLITTEIRNQIKKLGISLKQERFPWYFPSIGEYTTLMEEVGFKVTFANMFERPTPLDGNDGLRVWIEMFCKTLFGDLDNQKISLIVANVENSLKETMFIENKWIVDYIRLRVIGIKSKKI